MPRLVVPGEPAEPTLHIAVMELQRLVTIIVAKNPKAVLIMLETDKGLEWVSAPDSNYLQSGMIKAAYAAVMYPEDGDDA